MDYKTCWISTVFAVIAVGVIFLFLGRDKDWTGFYYPDASDLSIYQASTEMDSLIDCRAWAESKGKGKYECGRSCEFDFKSDMYICRETVD